MSATSVMRPSKGQTTIYLAGPISGCNDTQCHKWRDDFQGLFGSEFQFVDPSRWGKDWDFSREMLAIDECDIVVANMWKESIGTTIGIMHARVEGKPVVLIDSNYLDNNILKGLTRPDQPARTLKEAAARVKEAVEPFPVTEVKKKDGTVVPFDRVKLVKSIRAACVSANVDDTVLPQRIVALTFEELHRNGAPSTTTDQLKEYVYSSLQKLESNPINTSEVRDAARSIRKAWERREQYKQVEQVFDDAADENAALREQLAELQKEMTNLKIALGARATVAGDTVLEEEKSPLKNVEEAVLRARHEFTDDLVILDSAVDSAQACSYGNPEKAYQALGALATCANRCREAESEGRRPPGIAGLIKGLTGCSWLDYKTGEGEITMSLFGAERTFLYKDQPLAMPRHLAIGAGPAKGTLRIHFAKDEASGQFVVGWVGDHLPTQRRHK